MKQITLVFVALFLLMVLVAVPFTVTFAAADATCVANPPAGPVGTTFVITCTGFTPGGHVYAYVVEPAGVATTLPTGSGNLKAGPDGSITSSQPSAFGHLSTLATGTWTFVAEETGLAKSVLHRGQTTFRITGGTEGVSGASLSADPSVLHKAEKAYVTIKQPSQIFVLPNASDPVTLSGSGFAPFEMVTFWVEPPQGGCPSMTAHERWQVGDILSGVYAIYQNWQLNTPVYDGVGAQIIGSIKADAAGNAVGTIAFYSGSCEGDWHIVARGNTSHRGGDTHVTLVGNTFATNASLVADKATVTGLFDTINFAGSGFGANERLSCWLTSPRGQTLGYPVPQVQQFTIIDPGVGASYYRDQVLRSDANGSIAFNLVTGSIYLAFDQTGTIGSGSINASVRSFEAIQSEGALGEWAMSCRGNSSGATALARFTITGGMVDP